MNALEKKKSLGQFFTKNHYWLKNHILDFIKNSNPKIIFDPFAGEGDLLNIFSKTDYRIIGFDIDPKLNWIVNDSLLEIPNIKNSIIITNPPYLTNYSASRKKIYNQVEKYFNNCKYNDLYQLAIEKCLENNDFGIMIIPETFINSNFPKYRLKSITIIEDLIFNDTENPVCVVCFDKTIKKYNEILVYKNDKYIGTLEYFEKMRKNPTKKINMKFNSLEGNIALRAVDTTNIQKPIQFMLPNEINYDLTTIKNSSRLITLISLNIDNQLVNKVIKHSNDILLDFRKKTSDVLLSPFKGNKKNGERRRRLDYKTARAIIEEAYELIDPNSKLF